jgi:hypothetical protein
MQILVSFTIIVITSMKKKTRLTVIGIRCCLFAIKKFFIHSVGNLFKVQLTVLSVISALFCPNRDSQFECKSRKSSLNHFYPTLHD